MPIQANAFLVQQVAKIVQLTVALAASTEAISTTIIAILTATLFLCSMKTQVLLASCVQVGAIAAQQQLAPPASLTTL
jgi:hypothetical protein